MVEFNEILEFIKYILKILIYFDTKFVYLQKGGDKNNNKGFNGKSSNNSNTDKDVENDKDETDWNSKFWNSLNYLKELFMSGLKFVESKLLYLASVLLFASIAPILPFFIAMAGMFGVLKFFMFKLRRL